jgi:hypothetical protein
MTGTAGGTTEHEVFWFTTPKFWMIEFYVVTQNPAILRPAAGVNRATTLLGDEFPIVRYVLLDMKDSYCTGYLAAVSYCTLICSICWPGSRFHVSQVPPALVPNRDSCSGSTHVVF